MLAAIGRREVVDRYISGTIFDREENFNFRLYAFVRTRIHRVFKSFRSKYIGGFGA